jgi:hypothetical protein
MQNQLKLKKLHLHIHHVKKSDHLPTELPPPVGEVSVNFCGERVSRDQRNGFPRPLISVF